MKITIKEIAKKAGVSMTTVSNVINKKEKRVSKETIELVENIIKKYNYTPDMNARSLVQSSSKLIGILYFSPEKNFSFSDPFVSQILSSVEREAKKKGYFIFVHNITSEKDIKEIQHNWKFEGFIIVGVTSKNFSFINESLQIATVYIDTHLSSNDKKSIMEEPNCIFVNANDYQSGKTATKFLIKNGHCKIAFLSYTFNSKYISVIEQRYKAYMDVITANNIKFDEKLIYQDNEFDRLLKDSNQYSAVVISGDYLAAQFINYLKSKNAYEVGNPSIISFDNNAFSELIDPPLTTIHVNSEEKGVVAFNNLIKIANNKKIDKKFTYVNGKLIIRESVTKLSSNKI